ncbi:hypothetical protein BGZ67_002210 [Mortierella alpina]|nr:hypothetical protein BGZ67_002210 [Mortierella alpina]
MSSNPAGPEPQPTPAATPTVDPVILTTDHIITTTTTTTTLIEPSSAMSSPYQTPSDPPVVTTMDPVPTTVDPVTTAPSPPVTATRDPTGPTPTTAVIPPKTTQRPPDPTKDPVVTTVYMTRYITTMSVVTITTRVPHTTVIAGSVTTIYSIETTTTLVPTIIRDPTQPPPPPALFDIVPAGSNRGLRGWQLSLIIVAGFIFIGACASMFLVSWIRKKRLGTCAKDCGSAGSLMPVHLEPWNDPATAAAVMGPTRKGANGGGGGGGWRDYEKEDELADVDGGHLGPAGGGGAGALVLTRYSGEQDLQQQQQQHHHQPQQQQQQQQCFAEDSQYLAHGQDPSSGSERGADFYYDLQAAVAAAGAGTYPRPPNSLHLHPPQHPQYLYGSNPQESPTDPFHPSLFRDEHSAELLQDSSSQAQQQQPQQQESQSNYYQQQQQEPVSRPIALYSSPLMHLQSVGSPAYSNVYTNASQSPLTSVPLDGRNEDDYADGHGYGFYGSGVTPLQSREHALAGVDPSVQNEKTEHPPTERHSKVELRRKSPQALLMVLDRSQPGDYSSTDMDTVPTGGGDEGEEGQQSSGDVSMEGGVVEEVGGVGVGGGVGGGVGNGENIVSGDATTKEEDRSSFTAASASASMLEAIQEGHGRETSSASVATSGEGGSSVSGGSGVKARRLEQ